MTNLDEHTESPTTAPDWINPKTKEVGNTGLISRRGFVGALLGLGAYTLGEAEGRGDLLRKAGDALRPPVSILTPDSFQYERQQVEGLVKTTQHSADNSFGPEDISTLLVMETESGPVYEFLLDLNFLKEGMHRLGISKVDPERDLTGSVDSDKLELQPHEVLEMYQKLTEQTQYNGNPSHMVFYLDGRTTDSEESYTNVLRVRTGRLQSRGSVHAIAEIDLQKIYLAGMPHVRQETSAPASVNFGFGP